MFLGICGILGKMGSLVFECAKQSKDFTVNLGVDKRAEELVKGIFLTYKLKNINHKTNVLIDFSSREMTQELLEYAVRTKTPLVIGTTGQTTEDLIAIHNAAKEIPIMLCPNTSLGAAYLINSAKEGAQYFLDYNYEIDISETHHSQKKDAPSGTALAIANAILSVAPSLKQVTSFENGRQSGDLSISSRRLGGVVGEHEVSFASQGEILSIKHRVIDKKVFALGALECARYIAFKSPGLYSISDMFDFKKAQPNAEHLNAEQNNGADFSK